MKTYMKEFETVEKADSFMRMKNRACKLANNFKDLYCLVDGPSDNYAVVDLKSAIDLGCGYEWAS